MTDAHLCRAYKSWFRCLEDLIFFCDYQADQRKENYKQFNEFFLDLEERLKNEANKDFQFDKHCNDKLNRNKYDF